MPKTVVGSGAHEGSIPKKTRSPLAAGAKYFKKKEETGSTIWEHFTKVDENGGTKAICNYCGKYPRWTGVSTHLERHLRTCGKSSYGGIGQPLTIAESNESAGMKKISGDNSSLTCKKKEKRKNKSAAMNLARPRFFGEGERNFVVTREKIRENKVKNAIFDESPPMIVSVEEDRNIGVTREKLREDQVKNAILGEFPFTPPNVKEAWSRLMVTDMEKGICAYHQREKEKLVTQLGNLTSLICFSIEIMKQAGWISITAHFINDDFNLVKRLIGFKKLHESCEADIIESCISDWKLGNKILSFTTEWNCDLFKRLQGKFHSKLLFDGNHHQFVVPCFKKAIEKCYSVNLQGNYSIENMKIVEDVTACPIRMRAFREIAKAKGLPLINEDWSKRQLISLYVGTWGWKFFSSVNKIFEEVLRYKEVFHEPQFIEISKPIAHPECIRWNELENVVNYFQKINPIIELLSNFKHPTSNLYFENFKTIKKIFEGAFDDMDNSGFYDMYILCAASILDPRFKLKHFEDSVSEKGSDFQIFFDTLFGIYAKEKTSQAYPSSFQTAKEREKFLSTVIGFVELKSTKREMIEYLREEMVEGEDTNFDLLGWWKQKRSSYPVLSRMACDLLSIPACVYSVQESLRIDLRVLDEVSPELAEAVICSKDWILSDV